MSLMQDPTAQAVVRRDLGERFDRVLAGLTRLQLLMLLETSAGLSPEQIAQKHGYHIDIVEHASGVALRTIADLLERSPSEPGSDSPRSRLIRELEAALAPRCRHCGGVLRHDEQPRRGRRPIYCSAACRLRAHRYGAANVPLRIDNSGDGYLVGPDESGPILSPASETGDRDILSGGTVILRGAKQGRKSVYLDVLCAHAACSHKGWWRSCGTFAFPTLEAIQLYGWALARAGTKHIVIGIRTHAQLSRARRHGFVEARSADGRAKLIEGKPALVWSLDDRPAPPAHVIA